MVKFTKLQNEALFLKSKAVKSHMQQNDKSDTTKDRFVSFIENSFALEPLQDQARPFLPTECLERTTKLEHFN